MISKNNVNAPDATPIAAYVLVESLEFSLSEFSLTEIISTGEDASMLCRESIPSVLVSA
jgi:hypothetical protein